MLIYPNLGFLVSEHYLSRVCTFSRTKPLYAQNQPMRPEEGEASLHSPSLYHSASLSLSLWTALQPKDMSAAGVNLRGRGPLQFR